MSPEVNYDIHIVLSNVWRRAIYVLSEMCGIRCLCAHSRSTASMILTFLFVKNVACSPSMFQIFLNIHDVGQPIVT